MNQEERRKRIIQMADEIQYLATKPRLEGENDLYYTLELMTKAVGLCIAGEKADTLTFAESFVSQAYYTIVCKRAERDFTTLAPGLVSSC
ncbi:MAG: hypothetical protein HPY50_04530 [Firmicutes bacterium]|nr:hypothetical protein [Bacillota bacterium]